MSIKLNDIEQKIIDTLLAVVKDYDTKSTLRVAGGWVRDNLLGIDSKDIDIVVDNMSGEAFARLVNKWMESKGIETKNIGVIEANPDQSKHLATATTFIFGQAIDFAHLRTETYAADSRIPEVAVGTPKEDAFRRDLTINSLFYNINESTVEDFTGCGLADLEARVIRTPLDPFITFTDDPLRILRSARFAVRYDFNLSPDILLAGSRPEVRDGLAHKVSRERIGIEFYKMMISDRPWKALEYLNKMGLRDIVIGLLPGMCSWDMDQNNPYHEMTVWDHTVSVLKTVSEKFDSLDEADRALLAFTAVVHDTGKLDPEIQGSKVRDGKDTMTFYDHEEKSKDAAIFILQNLKYSNDLIERVGNLIRPAGRAEGLARKLMDGERLTRRSLGKFVRSAGADWRLAIEMGQADMISKKRAGPEYQYVKCFDALAEQIDKMDVNEAHTLKPILNGHEVMNLLNLTPGPSVGMIANDLIDWQLDNPEATKDDAIKWLLARE